MIDYLRTAVLWACVGVLVGCLVTRTDDYLSDAMVWSVVGLVTGYTLGKTDVLIYKTVRRWRGRP